MTFCTVTWSQGLSNIGESLNSMRLGGCKELKYFDEDNNIHSVSPYERDGNIFIPKDYVLYVTMIAGDSDLEQSSITLQTPEGEELKSKGKNNNEIQLRFRVHNNTVLSLSSESRTSEKIFTWNLTTKYEEFEY